MNGNDNKKYINLVPLEPHVHSMLAGFASQKGMPIADCFGLMANNFIPAFIQNSRNGKESADDIRCLEQINLLKLERDEQHMNHLARLYVASRDRNGGVGDEALAELLANACEIAGRQYDQVITSVENDPFISLATERRRNTKLAHCIEWLSQLFSQEEKSIPAAAIFELGKQRGFTESMLKNAKMYIASHSEGYQITSEKEGFGWNWVLVTRASDDEHAYKDLSFVKKQEAPSIL